MQPINFNGAIIIKSNGEENCNHIYAQPVDYPMPIQTVLPDGSIEEKQYTARYWREYWFPTPKDIENLLAGRGIVLELHCLQLTPVAMYTFDENGNVEEPIFDNNLKPEQ